MEKLLTPDLCVIGGGAGGLDAAMTAAQLGASVVLIEKHRMGGDSLNYGCVPSKSLQAAAKRAQAMRETARFGVKPVEPAIDHRLVNEHVKSVIAAIAPNDSAERCAGLGVQVVAGAARFKDKSTVLAGDIEIQARRFVIATGSSPELPPIPGLDKIGYLTNETIFDVNYRIGHLIVVGGGAVGLELAQAHRRLGSEVTVIEGLTPLPTEDQELVAVAVQRMRREGVRILDNARLDRLEPFGQNVQVVFTKDGRSYSIDGTHLLVASGRRPNVEGLNLEAAGVRYDRGGVAVSDSLRTSNHRIYAIGDVVGDAPFAHMASHHAQVVVRNALFRWPARVDRLGMPRIAYTEPEVAQVGVSEEEARRRYGQRIRVLRWPYHENDRAQAERTTDGFVKVVADRDGRILGAGAVGESAGEVIQVWALAMQAGIRMRAMADYVAPYPTLGEINQRAAQSFFMPSLTNPMIRRVIGWLARFG
ncbi:MAG: FAD-dependent oxidoreductase [Hyphomicrobiales bacterium]|nr:FAD-dependent oxidoreductase [Hyphomicrobiales bacterium]